MPFTLLWACGFEQNDVDVFIYPGDRYDDEIISTTRKTGSYGGRIFGNYQVGFFRTTVSLENRADIDVGMWLYINSHNTPCYVRARLNNGAYLDLRWDTSNKTWDAYVNGAKVADGTISPSITAFHNLQIRFKCDLSGYIYNKVDGVEDIVYNGDTRAGGSYITHIYFSTGTANGQQDYIDDWVVGYGGWPGDLRIARLTPNADTATEEWDLSTGSDSYALLDEVGPDDDSTYISTSGSSGEQTIVELGNFSADGTPIAAVVWGRARNTDPTGDKIKFLAGDGTYINELGEESPGTSYLWYPFVMNETSGSNPWSDAEADQLQLGVEAS